MFHFKLKQFHPPISSYFNSSEFADPISGQWTQNRCLPSVSKYRNLQNAKRTTLGMPLVLTLTNQNFCHLVQLRLLSWPS